MTDRTGRDSLGTVHLSKQFTASEPPKSSEAIFRVPREENVHLNYHTKILDTTGMRVEGRNETKITSNPAPSPVDSVPRPKRVLPTLPPSPSYRSPYGSSKENLGFDGDTSFPQSATKEAFSLDQLNSTERSSDGPCPQPLGPLLACVFCTATGPGTALRCMHCDNVYCMACLNSRHGSMFTYDGEQCPILRCAQCNKNPRSCPIEQRPPWQGTASVAGAPLLSVVGADRKEEGKLLRTEDKIFLSLLRTDTTVATADAPARMPSEGLPSVFQRLTNHRLFSGSHKHRFSADGVGLGLEGRRDDSLTQNVIAGNGTITRDVEREMDCPHKPTLSYEARPASASGHHRSDDDVPEVFNRLAKSPGAAPSGDYEAMLKARRGFETRTWKTGD